MSAASYTYSARSLPTAHARQQADCEVLARQLGYDITHVYQDEGGSRLALDRLLTDVRGGAVSILLVAGLDRLGRTSGALTSIIDALHDAQVTLYATGYGATPITDVPVLSILCAIEDYEDAITHGL